MAPLRYKHWMTSSGGHHVTTPAWFHRQAQQQRVSAEPPCYLDANKQQRQLIAELESKNRFGMTA